MAFFLNHLIFFNILYFRMVNAMAMAIEYPPPITHPFYWP
jgi:hypothetical protein